jgi:hypothetical protein
MKKPGPSVQVAKNRRNATKDSKSGDEGPPSKKHKSSISNESPKNQFGAPILLRKVPEKMLCNPIALSNIIRKACPSAKIQSQKCMKDTETVVLYPADPASSAQLQQADFSNTELRECPVFTSAPEKPKGKQVAILIAGVEPCIPVEDIGDELLRQDVELAEVVRMKDRKSGNPTYKVKITLSNYTAKEKLLQVGYIYLGYTRHRVLDFIEPPSVLVCYNCQGFGHMASECTNKPTCVRCGQNHRSSECKQDRDLAPTCCRCGGPHSAAYRGCEAFKEHQKTLLNKRIQETQAPNPLPVPPPVPPPSRDQPALPTQLSSLTSLCDTLVEVIFCTLCQYCPIPANIQSVLLSDLCQFTSEAFKQHSKMDVQAAALFANAKRRLKAVGRLPDK